MTDRGSPAQQQQQQPHVVLLPPRDPGTFSGTDKDKVNVEDWVALYERVSEYYRWDPTLMLANVVFYLRETALVWYETHESELTTWDTCKSKLIELFSRPFGRQQAARKDLESRVQTSTESYVCYIQDVLGLCRKADANMTEADKIAHILKGIADDAFNLLIVKDCTTVDAVVKECQRFEQAKSRRISRQFVRLPNTAATSTCQDPPTFTQATSSENVTRIVRRELEAMVPADVPQANASTVSLIQAVVRQEIANLGIAPVCSIRTPESTPAVVNQIPVYPSRYRNPAEWRTTDDRPICFHCSRVGHIARHCRNRWSSTSWNTGTWRRFEGNSRRFSPRSDLQATDVHVPSRRFSRSPSPQGRRSLSPLVRRSTSPTRPGPSTSGN